MRVLGIDPGSSKTGFGVIEQQGNTLTGLAFGILDLSKTASFSDKLLSVFEGLIGEIETHLPERAAVELPIHSVNARSTILLSQARAAAVLACKVKGLKVFEYAPNKVKSAVTGAGKAEKKQVMRMVKKLLNFSGDIPLDASDALAVAICHCQEPNPAGIANADWTRRNGTRCRWISPPKTKENG